MADDPEDRARPGMRSRDQMALLAASCLLLSVLAGMLPDGVVPSSYRTAGWLVLALLALAVMFFAFPHMWVYGLWLAGIWGACVFGLQLVLLGGERIFARWWAAAGIGLLMELAALFLLYTLVMRVRIARSVQESRAPLGLWLLSVMAFFPLCNISGASLAYWSAGGSLAALALYGISEAALGFLAVYICWAPEEAVWSAPRATAAATAATPGGAAPKKGGRKAPPAPEYCPSCGARLKTVRLSCPSCGTASEALWCPASESYVAPCPSCGSPTLSSDDRCIKCNSAYPGPSCPSCGRASPARDWSPA